MFLEFHQFGTDLKKPHDLAVRADHISAVRVNRDEETYLDLINGHFHRLEEHFLDVLAKINVYLESS